MPPENLSKINVKIAYFSEFLQAEMVSSAVVSRQLDQIQTWLGKRGIF